MADVLVPAWILAAGALVVLAGLFASAAGVLVKRSHRTETDLTQVHAELSAHLTRLQSIEGALTNTRGEVASLRGEWLAARETFEDILETTERKRRRIAAQSGREKKEAPEEEDLPPSREQQLEAVRQRFQGRRRA